MLRTLRRVQALAAGETFSATGDPDENTDTLVHFLQDAYHLTDWIKNEGASKAIKHAAEGMFCTSDDRCRRPGTHSPAPTVMRLCADICNGAKHQTTDEATRRIPDTGIASEHVQLDPSALTAQHCALRGTHGRSSRMASNATG